MTLSAEYSCDEKGDRGGGGGALAHQRRLIRGLFVWATLLTLGLATSLTLHFIHKEPPAPQHKPQDPGNMSLLKTKPSIPQSKSVTYLYDPNWDPKNEIRLLRWFPADSSLIEGTEKLTVREQGEYFLYMQVSLASQKTENYVIEVKTDKRTLLKGNTNRSNSSTGFMGAAVSMNTGETFYVTCSPNAPIQAMDTYMGVIKLR